MKKRRNNRLIALMLTMILLFSSVAGNAFALDLADAAMSEQANTPTQEPISQDASLSGSSAEETAEPQIIEEDVSKRGKFEKHYLCSDGSYMAVVYPEQVNYYDGGEWKEVDSTLTLSMSGDRYVSSNADVSAQFAKNSASEELVSLTDGEYSISWRVDFSGSSNKLTAFDAPVSSVASVKNPTASTRAISEENITSLDKFSSQLSYRNVYNNKVDLRYSVYYGRVEEDIILNSADALTSYKLTVNTGGLTAVKNADNSISFNDGEGNTIFTIAAPWMKDAASEVSENIEVALVQKGDTAYIIYAPDSEWLTAKERVFPVLIDPSVTTRKYTSNYTDTYVYTGDSASTTTKTQPTMKLGYQNGIEYVPYFKINNIPNLPAGQVEYNSVTLKFYTSTTNITMLKLSAIGASWNPDTITYADQPTSTVVIEQLLGSTNGTKKLYSADITDYVNYANQGALSNYPNGCWTVLQKGFKLQSVFTSKYSEIYASENVEFVNYIPVLIMNYSYTPQECIENNAVYSFKNVNSGKYLTAGSNVYQVSKVNTASQAFRLISGSITGGYFLGAMNSSNGNGNIVAFNYAGSVNSGGYNKTNAYCAAITPTNIYGQEWLIYFIDYNCAKIISGSDPNLALTAYGTSTGSDSGTSTTSAGNVYVAEYTGSASQHWYIESGGQELGRYYENIKNTATLELSLTTHENLCCPVENFGDTVTWTSSNTNVATVSAGRVDAVGVGTTTITATVTSTDGTTATNSCTVYVVMEDDTYFLNNAQIDKYLQIDNDCSPTAQWAPLELWSMNVLGTQKWNIEYLDIGYYKITSVGSGKALTAPSSVNNYITQSTYTGDTTQQWLINSVGNGKVTVSPRFDASHYMAAELAASLDGVSVKTLISQYNATDEWYLYEVNYEYSIVHYYDRGYTTRFGNAYADIKSYQNICSKILLKLFGVGTSVSVYNYNSSADECNENSVTLADTKLPCDHTGLSHKTTSRIRSDLVNEFGAGNDTLSRVAWTGHALDGVPRSDSNSTNHTVVITPAMVIDYNQETGEGTLDNDPNKDLIREFSFTLTHELSHQLGAHDHYCRRGYSNKDELADKGGIKCANEYCDVCYSERDEPRSCIMSYRYDLRTVDLETLYCGECLSLIRSHLEGHH